MELAFPEPVLRLGAFVICLALLTAAEAAAPRRRRAIRRRPRWAGNVGLVILDTALVRAIPLLSAVAMAGLAEARGWGLLQAIGPLPDWVAIAASVALLDLAIYLQHVLFHALPALWRLHRVHHTDPEVDVTTGVRFHPVEILLSAAIRVGVVGLLGAPVAGVVVFEILLNAGSLFSHANVRVPARADRALRTIIVTPDMHRVHHSIDRAERDCNFGFTLSWWDRLFGTYRAQPRKGHDAMALGVAGFTGHDVLGFHRLLAQPLLRERATVDGTTPYATPQEDAMAATPREAVRELLQQTMATMEALLEASDRELPLPSSHGCAQGKDLWTLITNDIDHEKIHTGQVLEGRYESRITASPMQRLIAEWLEERARFIGSLVGLTDEQFNTETAPGQWTYRVIAKHVLMLEQDSLKTLAADRAARASGDGAPTR
jgi:sterol desaturase/sphingolipid hydroxylase (fatty acid hydroxylase superfamily)